MGPPTPCSVVEDGAARQRLLATLTHRPDPAKTAPRPGSFRLAAGTLLAGRYQTVASAGSGRRGAHGHAAAARTRDRRAAQELREFQGRSRWRRPGVAPPPLGV